VKTGNSSRCCESRPDIRPCVFQDKTTVPICSEWEGPGKRDKSEDLPGNIDFAACGERDADQTMFHVSLPSSAAKSKRILIIM